MKVKSKPEVKLRLQRNRAASGLRDLNRAGGATFFIFSVSTTLAIFAVIGATTIDLSVAAQDMLGSIFVTSTVVACLTGWLTVRIRGLLVTASENHYQARKRHEIACDACN